MLKKPLPEPPTVQMLVDDLHAREVFADEAVGIFIHQGSVHLTFASHRADHGAAPCCVRRVVVSRLVMPLPAAHAMMKFLSGALEKAKGHPPAPPCPAPRILQ